MKTTSLEVCSSTNAILSLCALCVCVQWKRLLPQLFALDQGLEDLEEHQPGRHNYNLAVYHNSDKYCAGIIIGRMYSVCLHVV